MPNANDPPAEQVKLRELILHVCLASETDPHFRFVKLNKLLFFADFGFFRLHARPITGAEYQKLPFGPAPRAMLSLLDAMVAQGDLYAVEREHFGRRQKKYFARRQPDFSAFACEEIAFTDDVIRALWNDNATELSAIASEFLGWKFAEPGEIIPYGTALLDDRELTEAEKQAAAHLDWSGFEEMAA